MPYSSYFRQTPLDFLFVFQHITVSQKQHISVWWCSSHLGWVARQRPRSTLRQGIAPVGCHLATMALKIKTATIPKRWVCTAEVVTQPGTSVHLGWVARDWRTFCHLGSKSAGTLSCNAPLVLFVSNSSFRLKTKDLLLLVDFIIVSMGIFPWEIRVVFPEESQLRQSCRICNGNVN